MCRKKNFWVVLVIIIILAVIIACYFVIINPILIKNANITLESLAKKAINQAIYTTSEDRVLYDDMININYNDIGHISLIQVKSYEANLICNNIILNTERIIEDLGEKGFKLKSGVLSAIPILGGVGKNIVFNFQQIGAVNCTYTSKFVSAGVNQTLHQLYANINVNVSVILPLNTDVIKVSQSVLLCENILVGDIPYTYLQSTELDPLLNLIPS